MVYAEREIANLREQFKFTLNGNMVSLAYYICILQASISWSELTADTLVLCDFTHVTDRTQFKTQTVILIKLTRLFNLLAG